MKTSPTALTNSSAAPGRPDLGSAGAQRLPAPPRERKPALAALAVLLILGGALASAYLVIASGQRVSAITIAQPVAAGQPIPMSALREAQVGDTGIEFVRWSERVKVTEAYAAVQLVPGTLLTNAMTTSTDDAAKGRVVVGLALKPGQLPAAGLQVGQRVSLYAVGSGTGTGPRPGTVLAEDAVVYDIGEAADRMRSDQITVSVAVPPDKAPLVTQAASAGEVAVAIVPTGTEVVPRQPTAPRQSTAPEPDPQPDGGAGTGPAPGGGTAGDRRDSEPAGG